MPSTRFHERNLPHLAIVCLALVAALLVASAGAAPGDPDASGQETRPAGWVVGEDTTWRGEHRIPGNLTVTDDAVLTLEGADVQVGGRVQVDAGSTLRMGPGGDEPARLGPLDAEQDFWLQVDGRLETGGTPRSVIEGLSGDGLASVFDVPGGLKVNGSALLEDAVVRDGTAGIIVAETAHVTLRRAEVADLYLMGVAALGTLQVEDSWFYGNTIPISGRGGACSVTVEGSMLEPWAGALHMVGCPATVSDSRIRGGGGALATSGGSEHRFTNTTVEGYRDVAFQGDGHSRIVLRDVTIDPAVGEVPADPRMDRRPRHAVHLAFPGHELVMDGVRIRAGHAEDAVRADAPSTLDLRDATIHGSGGYGLRAHRPVIVGDLAGVDFGTANADGPVRITESVDAAVLSASGAPMAGARIEVLAGDSEEPVATAEAGDSGWMQVALETHRMQVDGGVARIEDFRYRITHGELGRAAEGGFDPAAGKPIVVEFAQGAAPAPSGGTGPPVWVAGATLFAAGAALLAFGVYAQHRSRRTEDAE